MSVRRSASWLLALALLAAPMAAGAATLTVTTTDDELNGDGDCSLREAVASANGDAQVGGCAPGGAFGDDTIVLPSGTYDLSLAIATELVINDETAPDNLTIQGGGAATTFLQANATVGLATFRVMNVLAGDLTVEDVTIRNGGGTDNGGAIRFNSANNSALTITNSILEDNRPTASGGAIHVTAGDRFLTFTGTTFRGNRALGTNSTGGAGNIMANGNSTVDVTDCVVEDNRALSSGGGFKLAQNIDEATFERVRFTGNLVTGNGADGGALSVQAEIFHVIDCTFDSNEARNEGGAIRIGAGTNTSTISGSTFLDNLAVAGSAGDGGAIREAASDLTITNSTFHGNRASDSGGAIHKNGTGTMILNNVTVTGNTCDTDISNNGDGGGVRRQNGTVIIANSIIAGNSDLSGNVEHPDCSTGDSDFVISQGYNLLGIRDLGACTSFSALKGDKFGTDAAPLDPLLAALADNGGQTETRLPLDGSPVLDAGNPATPFDGSVDVTVNGNIRRCLPSDQRGLARPVDVTCDIGAAEGTGEGICGDGVLDPGEECESPFGDCCNPNTCLFRTSEFVCREGSGDTCDPHETCTGVSAECPADVVQPGGTVCRAGSGDVCDPDETCSGNAQAACPADTVTSAGTVCRSGSGDICDPDEVCTGTAQQTCPQDLVAPGGTVCRSGSGDVCDPDETCTGGAGQACPSDVVSGSQTTCRAAVDSCDVSETCPGAAGQACPADIFAEQGTSCSGDANPCTTDACDGAGNCTPVTNESSCDDGQYCTVGDTCIEGACVGTPRNCSDSNSCTDDGCSEGGDTCTHSANDAPCSDGNACTLVDACIDGQCVGSSPVDCDDDDVCTVDECDPGSGLCINDEAPRNDCHTFGATSLLLSDPDGSGTKAKLKWAWSKGTPTLVEEFGDPTGDTDYTLCIYDTEGGVSSLATRLEVPAGAPWQARSDRGFRRKDGTGASDGVTKAVLRTNGKGKGDLVVKAGFCQRCSSSAAANLPLPPLAGTGFLSNEPTVSAQLVGSNGQCWLSEFQTIRTNTTERFSARARQ